MAINHAKWLLNIPNGHKIYHHFLFQGPPKCTQMGIFWFENVPSGNPEAAIGEKSYVTMTDVKMH
jgi:hypothetical protein